MLAPIDPNSSSHSSTIKRLIVEVERSHRSEAQARQQAADAVAARQMLSEASATSTAEVEAALMRERRTISAHRLAAETAHQRASVCLDVHNVLLSRSLREAEADVAHAWGKLEAISQSATSTLEREVSEASHAADAQLAALRAEHAVELDALRSEAARWKGSIGPLEESLSATQAQTHRQLQVAVEAVQSMRDARDRDAASAGSAIAACESRARVAEVATITLQSELGQLDILAAGLRGEADGARAALGAATQSQSAYTRHVEEASERRESATASAARDLSEQLSTSEAAVGALQMELNQQQSHAARAASRAEASRRVSEASLAAVVRDVEAESEHVRRHTNRLLVEMRREIEGANGILVEERSGRQALEASLAGRMQQLEGMMSAAIEAREAERVQTEARAAAAVDEARAVRLPR